MILIKYKSDMIYNTDSTLMTVFTVGCYVLFVITLQSVVAVAVLISAISTALLNVYKFNIERNNQKKKNKPETEKPKQNE